MDIKKTNITLLLEAEEYLAAGYSELPEGSAITRQCRALRRLFELAPLPEGTGEPVYPAGRAQLPHNHGVAFFSYTAGLVLDHGALARQLEKYAGTPTGAALAQVGEEIGKLYVHGSSIPWKYVLGGNGFTHSILNYGRIMREGFAGYEARIQQQLEKSDSDKQDFYLALLDLLEGFRALARRAAEVVCSQTDLPNAVRLAQALANVPEQPAQNFYEAVVAANFMWFAEGADNYGRIDQDLGAFLDNDLAAGTISRAEALELVRLLWRNINNNDAWNVAIGGSDRQGHGASNTLTELCLEAAKGSRRPNLALRVRRDMPEKVFDLALEAIASGCGIPALYNEELYAAGVQRIYACAPGDEYNFAFGGCTETMIHGCSNVGSIDGGVNLLAVLTEAIKQYLPTAASYTEFEAKYLADLCREIAEAAACINRDQELKAASQPQPIRTLFIDDCIDNGRDFNSGGARYNGGVFNLGGLANVADALAAIKMLVFEGEVSAAEMIAALEANFAEQPQLLSLIRSCPRFGNDDDCVDAIAVHIATAAFAEVRSHRTWRGDTPFLPGCIMFVTYAMAGEAVGATPDGRLAGEPVADSIGPVQGRDIHGPTAMLRSVSKLPLGEAIGTPVLNIRFARSMFDSDGTRDKIKSLIRTFFDLGGMQIQVSVVDQAALRDAIAHPEKHNDLIIRIGGYSEYFNRLSQGLQQAVLERTEHN
jgi:pyruvate-formate lyase